MAEWPPFLERWHNRTNAIYIDAISDRLEADSFQMRGVTISSIHDYTFLECSALRHGTAANVSDVI